MIDMMMTICEINLCLKAGGKASLVYHSTPPPKKKIEEIKTKTCKKVNYHKQIARVVWSTR